MTEIKKGKTNITDYDIGTAFESDWRFAWYGSFPEIPIPDGFTLDHAYRYDESDKENGLNERVNIELLAALGSFSKDQPFIPITIDSAEEAAASGLPTIERVEIEVGKTLFPKQSCWVGEITYIESIVVTAHTSDGKVFSSPIDVAVDLAALDPEASEFSVYLTPKGKQNIEWDFLMTLLGGIVELGDTEAEEERLQEDFEEELQRYYIEVEGPSEWLRDRIVSELKPLGDNWKHASYTRGGGLMIEYNDGSVIEIPAETTSINKSGHTA